jgi:hypothetical protein
MKSPQEAAEKWARNLASAGPSIVAGVNAVQVNPAQAAAAQADVAARNYQKAISEGKWQAGLARTTLAGWQNAMKGKGVQRIAEGATQGKPKMVQFLQQLIPAVEAAKANLPPRGDKAANRQRMIQFSEQMSNFKRSQ